MEPVAVRLHSVLELVHMEDTHWQPLVLVLRKTIASCATRAGMEREEGPTLSVQGHVRQVDGLRHRQALVRAT